MSIINNSDITKAFAEMRIVDAEEFISEEDFLRDKSPIECRVYYFNKLMTKSSKRLEDDSLTYKSRLKKVSERFLSFNNITFDCNKVLLFLDALATFAQRADKAQCFDEKSFRLKYKDVVKKLFKNVLTPKEALEEGKDLKEISDTIILNLTKVTSFYKNCHELGLKSQKKCPDAVRSKLIADYSASVKKIKSQVSWLCDKIKNSELIQQKKRLRKEIKRLSAKTSATAQS